jgi:hypothetical protein
MHYPSQLLASCCLLLVACSAPVDDATGMEGTTLPSGGFAAAGAGSGVSGSAVNAAGTATSGGTAADMMTAGSGGVMELGGSGGAGSLGGSSGGQLGGSAGAGGGSVVPKGPIDFSYWVLQLPTGSGNSPTQISSAELLKGFKNEYFYLGDDLGQMFMDPPQGITTKGSTRCRTEMREQKPTGGAAAWPSSGTHSMTVEGKVVKMTGSSVTIGQLFNDTDSIPLGELQYSTSHKFSLYYEEAKSAGAPNDLKTTVDLNTRYTFVMAMTDGKFTISINGKQVFNRTPGSGVLGNNFYFKFGNYDQGTSDGTPSTTVHSIVEVYKVDVVHQ